MAAKIIFRGDPPTNTRKIIFIVENDVSWWTLQKEPRVGKRKLHLQGNKNMVTRQHGNYTRSNYDVRMFRVITDSLSLYFFNLYI